MTIRVERRVLAETELVMGVTTHVLEARELVDGQLYEVARNFYVEASDGTVPNPAAKRPAEGIAVVLLRRKFRAVGALCFTWGSNVVPVEGSRAEEMIDILGRWAQAFGVGLSRLYRLREELSKA